VRWHITINFFPPMLTTMDDADDIRRQGWQFIRRRGRIAIVAIYSAAGEDSNKGRGGT
jgi:hypothetical protein